MNYNEISMSINHDEEKMTNLIGENPVKYLKTSLSKKASDRFKKALSANKKLGIVPLVIFLKKHDCHIAEMVKFVSTHTDFCQSITKRQISDYISRWSGYFDPVDSHFAEALSLIKEHRKKNLVTLFGQKEAEDSLALAPFSEAEYFGEIDRQCSSGKVLKKDYENVLASLLHVANSEGVFSGSLKDIADAIGCHVKLLEEVLKKAISVKLIAARPFMKLDEAGHKKWGGKTYILLPERNGPKKPVPDRDNSSTRFIPVSEGVWKILARIAKQRKVSIDEALEFCCEEAIRSASKND